MKLEKVLVVFIIIQLMMSLYFNITYFRIPYWIQEGILPRISDFGYFIRIILGYIADILAILGIIKISQLEELKIVKAFSLFIYLFVIEALFFYLLCIFSTEFSIFGADFESAPWFNVPLKFFRFFFLLLIFYYYLFVNKKTSENKITKPVNQFARFINRLIDLTIVLAIAFSNIDLLSNSETIFGRDSFFNSNPYWFIALNLFIYYFVLESLFLQTIGKLHNNSFVTFEQNRFKSILIRTFGRFLPFEAFSFFGAKGWHDGISETSVVSVKAINLSDENILDDTFVKENYKN